MRMLLIAASTAFSVSVAAQHKSGAFEALLEKYKQQNPLSLKLTVPAERVKQLTAVPKGPVYLQTLASGAKVYALPQDNMPCIVPPPQSVMPVVTGLKADPHQPGTIPNPAYKNPVVIPQTPRGKTTILKRP